MEVDQRESQIMTITYPTYPGSKCSVLSPITVDLALSQEAELLPLNAPFFLLSTTCYILKALPPGPPRHDFL